MIKFFKLTIASLLIVACSCISVACYRNGKSDCKHELRYTIISQATCTEDGEMEGICSKCGFKQYDKLAKMGHNYTWTTTSLPTCTKVGSATGICSYCGDLINATINAKGHNFVDGTCNVCLTKEEATLLPDGTTIGLSLNDIAQIAINYGVVSNKNEFIQYVINSNSVNVSIKNDRLFFEVNGFYFSYGVEKVDCDNASGSTNTIVNMGVTSNYLLTVTYLDGTNENVGYIDGEYENKLKTIAVNTNNELLVTFENNAIYKIGTLSSAPLNVDESVLIYKKISGKDEYEVVGCLDENIENLVIPKTHRGLPVTRINEYAFMGYDKLVSVTLGENVTTIERYAFYSCDNLTTVNLNGKLNYVNDLVFAYCPLSTVNYNGTIQDKANITIVDQKLNQITWNFLKN